MSTAAATVVENPPKAGESAVEKPHGEVKSKIESGDVSGVYRIAQSEVDEELARGLGLSKIDDPNAGTIAGPEIVALKQADAEFENKAKTALGGLKTSMDSVGKPTAVESDATETPVVVEKTTEEKQLEVLDADIKRGVDEFEQDLEKEAQSEFLAKYLSSEDQFTKRRKTIAEQKALGAVEQNKIVELEAKPRPLTARQAAYLESVKLSEAWRQADIDVLNAEEGLALATKAGDTVAQARYTKELPQLESKYKMAWDASVEGYRQNAIAAGYLPAFEARQKQREEEGRLSKELPVPQPDAPLTRKEETEQGEVTVTELKGTEADQLKDEVLTEELGEEQFGRLENVRKELATEQLALHEFENTHGKAHTPLEQAYLDALKNRITALEFEKVSHESSDESFEAKAKQAELKQKADKAEAAYQALYDSYMNQPVDAHPEKPTAEAPAAAGALHLDDDDLDYEARQYEQFHPGQSFGTDRPTAPKGKSGIETSPMGAPPKPKGRVGKFIDSLKFWNYLSGKQ